MYHQWFNSAEYGKKEKALINAINALGSKNIPYGEQPDYDKKIETVKNAFDAYLNFCEAGHKQEVENIKSGSDELNLTK